MLNRPGEEVAAPPELKDAEQSEASPLTQIALIGVVGLYLFGMVWLYAHLTLLAVAGTMVAIGIIIFGWLRRIRNENSPDTTD